MVERVLAARFTGIRPGRTIHVHIVRDTRIIRLSNHYALQILNITSISSNYIVALNSEFKEIYSLHFKGMHQHFLLAIPLNLRKL